MESGARDPALGADIGGSPQSTGMKIVYKISAELLCRVKKDLRRSHAFAYERIGFLLCRNSYSANDTLTIYAFDYAPVPDKYYVLDDTVGVRFGKEAIQQALILAFNEGEQNISIFHVHAHMGNTVPWFSRTDLDSAKTFIPDIFNTAPTMVHGTIVLNESDGAGMVWLRKNHDPTPIDTFISIGVPTTYSHYHDRTLF